MAKKKGFRLAHVSDTHIKNLKYHDDYRACFEQMYNILREEKPDYIVHCGDVAHTKTQLSPEFFEMAANFFDSLSDIAPLVLIAGNHDGNLKNPNRQDALTPVVNALDKDTIHYLKNSGEFSPQKGLTFNVLSVFDRDNWVSPTDDKSINIALYHGAIAGVETDLGWVMDHGEDNIEIFGEHDFAFLGDIHKTNQILDTEGRVRYCGSTIQQNFGETNDKGFLIWDIKDKDTFDVRHFVLENPRPFITIELTKTGRIPKAANPPEGARLRIVTTHSTPLDKVRKAIDIAKTKFKPESITYLNKAGKNRSRVDIDEDFEKHNLRDIAVQENFIKEFLKDYLSDTEEDNEVLKEILEINRRINAEAESEERASYRNVSWSIKSLEWDNLFNYGEGNKIDFDNLAGIIGIFGKNFSGKSSIIDSMLWVLFNNTTKSKRSLTDLINQNRDRAWGKIVIELDNRHYTIERSMERRYSKSGEETSPSSKVDFWVNDLATGELLSLNGETVSQTTKNIEKFFSSIEDFQMTSLSSQLDSLAFITEKSTKRKAILAKFLDLEIFDSKYEIAKKESSLLEGKIKYLLERKGDISADIRKAEAEENIAEKTKELFEQENECRSLNKELEEVSLEVARVETKMDSTNVQQLIDPDEEKAKIVENTDRLGYVQKRNKTLEELILKNEGVIIKIDDFLKTFDYEGWIKKKEGIEIFQRELDDLFVRIEQREATITASHDRMAILKQVPCGDKYPTCKFIKEAHKNVEYAKIAKRELIPLKKELQEKQNNSELPELHKVEEYLDQHSLVIEKRKKMKEGINDYELEIAKNKTTIVTLRNMISKSQDHVRLFEENEASVKEFASLTKQRAELMEQKKKLKKKLTSCEDKIKVLNKEQGRWERELNQIITDDVELESSQRDYSAYDLYKKAMGSNGVSLDIIKKELPLINDEIAKILANVVNFEVYLENEGKDLKVLIKHPSFDPRPLEMGSGAEKTIAAMAIRLAFTNVSSLPIGDTFILDEPGTALDEENMEGFIRILDLVKSHFKNVILISHLDSLKDAVDLQISIEKKDKFAFVNQ